MLGRYCESADTNPYNNLALEEYLLHCSEHSSEAILYLWQNDNTIVIGRNQNAYVECNLEYANKHNAFIARRLTGGGAVYHDSGNLNFTIILPKSVFDIKRSTNIIVNALKNIGINAEINGRNDICLNGKKISGNAYYSNSLVGLHHGTLLYKVDVDKIENMLLVSKNKLSKHGVKSVKSRVCNISDLYPDITVSDIKNALKESFCAEYNIKELILKPIKKDSYSDLLKKYSSDEWNYNKIKDYNISSTHNFSWGKVDISFVYDGETLKSVEIATDALEADLIENIKSEINKNIKQKITINLDCFDKADNEAYKAIINDLRSVFADKF